MCGTASRNVVVSRNVVLVSPLFIAPKLKPPGRQVFRLSCRLFRHLKSTLYLYKFILFYSIYRKLLK